MFSLSQQIFIIALCQDCYKHSELCLQNYHSNILSSIRPSSSIRIVAIIKCISYRKKSLPSAFYLISRKCLQSKGTAERISFSLESSQSIFVFIEGGRFFINPQRVFQIWSRPSFDLGQLSYFLKKQKVLQTRVGMKVLIFRLLRALLRACFTTREIRLMRLRVQSQVQVSFQSDLVQCCAFWGVRLSRSLSRGTVQFCFYCFKLVYYKFMQLIQFNQCPQVTGFLQVQSSAISTSSIDFSLFNSETPPKLLSSDLTMEHETFLRELWKVWVGQQRSLSMVFMILTFTSSVQSFLLVLRFAFTRDFTSLCPLYLLQLIEPFILFIRRDFIFLLLLYITWCS